MGTIMKWKSNYAALSILGIVAASLPASAQLCVAPGGAGGCHATIQNAVTAALAGQTITIRAGTYHEVVNIPAGKDNILLVGSAASVLEAGPLLTGPAITVGANGVSIDTLTIINPRDSGVADGHGILVQAGMTSTEVRGVRIRGAQNDCVHSLGSPALFEKNELVGCGEQGIHAIADDVSVMANKMRSCGAGCVLVNGNSALVDRNRISLSENSCIRVNGDAAEVLSNRVTNCSNAGIQVLGDLATVERNKVTTTEDEGINVSGNGFVVSRNRIDQPNDEGVEASCVACTTSPPARVDNNRIANAYGGADGARFVSDAAGLSIQRNRVTRTNGSGFHVQGTGVITVVENRVMEAGGARGAAGFAVSGGAAHVVMNNHAQRVNGDGFSITAGAVVLTGNTAKDNLIDGFDIEGAAGVALTGNTANNNGVEGFEIGDDGTGAIDAIMSGNNAAGNRTNYCQDAGATVTDSGGNSFTIAGADPCLID